MYVCLCNALNDRDLAEAARLERASVAEVFRRCGAKPRCGKCLPDVAQMIADARALEETCAAAE